MIALIDYGMGNLLSVSKALEHVGARVEMVNTPTAFDRAEALVLPGVGHFGDGMARLRTMGLLEPIRKFIASGRPFLGICLGMQMLMEKSEEAPGIEGIGIFKGEVRRFPSQGLKVPHMGWNQVKIVGGNPLPLTGIPDQSYFYFVHSYYVCPDDRELVLASCEYMLEFAAALGRGHIFATQFHPEKSQDRGLTILENFVRQIN